MRIRIHWMGRRPRSGSDARLDQFRRVLDSALLTEKYRPLLGDAGYPPPGQANPAPCIEQLLGRLPITPGEEYRASLEDIRNAGAPPPELQPFRFPFEPVPRTAVLMPGFEQTGQVRVFASDWARRLERFRPEAIAAPVPVLRYLAEDTANLPPLSNALIVFRTLTEEPLAERDRELFWRAFQVPVFEQQLGYDGRVIAWECEAHDGLHIEPGNAIIEDCDGELVFTSLTDLRHPALRISTGFSARIDGSVCECGRREPRLTGLRLSQPELAVASCAAD